MALKDFKKISIPTEVLKLQDNILEWLNQLNKTLLHGVILKDVTINTTSTDVSHGLQRSYQGWQILDLQGDARVWRDTSSASPKDKFLPLKASSQVIVSLWVY